MRKAYICLSMAIMLILFLPQNTRADEILKLKEQMKAVLEQNAIMKRQLREQSRQIEDMRKKFETLESQKASRMDMPQDTQDRVIALEEKLEKPWQGRILSLRGENWELGGEVELEFVDTQNDASISEHKPHFKVDKFVLTPKFFFSDNVSLKADLLFTGGTAKADEAYVTISALPFNSKLKIGLDDRFIMPSRKTEHYPLAGTAFWADEEIGITLSTEHKPFYGILTFSQGLELDEKDVGEDSSSAGAYAMLHDDTRSSQYGGIKEIGVGLGFKDEIGSLGKVGILGFGYFNKLSDNDMRTLEAGLIDYTSDDDDQYRVGINFDYTLKNFNLFAQYIDSNDGGLDRYAWYIQPSYKVELPFAWKYSNFHTLLVRYGEYKVDTAKAFASPATWNRYELSFAMITEVVKNVVIKTEYSINDEDTGSVDVNNDELLMQLELKF